MRCILSHFELPAFEKPIKLSGRIKLKEKVTLKDRPKIKLHTPILFHVDQKVNPEEKIEIKVKRVWSLMKLFNAIAKWIVILLLALSCRFTGYHFSIVQTRDWRIFIAPYSIGCGWFYWRS